VVSHEVSTLARPHAVALRFHPRRSRLIVGLRRGVNNIAFGMAVTQPSGGGTPAWAMITARAASATSKRLPRQAKRTSDLFSESSNLT
jgi:hypothetical protein